MSQRGATINADPGPRRRTLLVLIYATALITFVLLPLDLAWPADFRAALRGPVTITGWSWNTVLRWVGHLLAFAPAGVLLASRRSPRPIVAVVAMLLIATAGEALQIFVSRGFSIADVLFNAAGAGIGYALASYVRHRRAAPPRPVAPPPLTVRGVRAARRRRAALRRRPSNRGPWLALIALLLVTTALVATPNTWSSWDPTFRLVLGNEATGDRPWRGQLLDVALYDRILGPGEIHAIMAEWPLPPNAALRFDFTPESMDVDGDGVRRIRNVAQAGLGPDLVVTRGRVDAIDARGIAIETDAMIEGETTPDDLIAWLETTRAASLVIRFRAADVAAEGPGRMFTISHDPLHRNLMLGQQGADLHFRVRNRVSGSNGTKPTLVVPGAVDPERSQVVIALCTPRESRVVVDLETEKHLAFPGLVRMANAFFGMTAHAPLIAGLLLMAFLAYALVFFLLLRRRMGSSWRCEITAAALALATLGAFVGLSSLGLVMNPP